MCENARIFQLTAVETLQRSLPCKQPQLFATVTSFRGNNAICRPHTHTQMLLLLLQPQFCNVYCEESSPNSPFIFAVSSASCLLICGTSTHAHTHAGNWNVTVSQEKEQNSPTLVLIFSAVTEEYDSFAMQLGCAGYTAYTGYTHMQFAGTESINVSF